MSERLEFLSICLSTVRDIHQDGFTAIRYVYQASRLSAPFQQSLRPDSTPQRQTSWFKKTLQVRKNRKLQLAAISAAPANDGDGRAGEEILPLRRHEEI